MSEDMKNCPYCGQEIKQEAVKCKHCGKFLEGGDKEITLNLPLIIKYAKIGGFILACIGILVFVIWVLFFDYAGAMRNRENFWYGQYILSAILHTLLAILCTLIAALIKK